MEKGFRGFMDVIHEMNRMSQQVHGTGPSPGPDSQERMRVTAWAPTTDVFVKDLDLAIRAELPGTKLEDIEITLSGGVLTIAGERQSGFDEDAAVFYVRERLFGAFRRTMNLPEGIDESQIAANFEDGVLEITIPGAGAAAPEPRHIQVKGAPKQNTKVRTH